MTLWNIFADRLRKSVLALSAKRQTRKSGRRSDRFRPAVLALEDRTVPSADSFGDALGLDGLLASSTGTNVGATTEVGEPDPSGTGRVDSVWWVWTAPSAGTVEVNTFGSDFDTVLGVYTGDAVHALSEVGKGDDYYDMQSRVLFTASAGTTYYFLVDGYGEQTGNVVINLGVRPGNDDFLNAATFDDPTEFGSNLAATGEQGEPSTGQLTLPINSVWWAWTAESGGSVEFNTFGSNFDTVLSVYTGSSLTTLTPITFSDDQGGFLSQVTFEAQQGVTYYVAVDGSGVYTGSIVLNYHDRSGAANRPPSIDPGQTFSVAENAPGGTPIGIVDASDPDSNQSLTYAIIAGDPDGAFFINRTTGELSVLDGGLLDFEADSSFELLVSVTDNGTPTLSTSATVVVNVTNDDDAPEFVAYGPFSVAENSAAGTVVGTVLAVDPDPTQQVSYEIVLGNTSGAFAVDPVTGTITVANAAAIDFETNAAFSLSVEATDNGPSGLSTTQLVTVFVQNGNEAPVLLDQEFSVRENSVVGTVAAVVAASDPDAMQYLTFAIECGNDAGAFAIDPRTGWITVADSSLLDYEADTSFVLTVRVTDSGAPVKDAVARITIDVEDVNEVPQFEDVGPFRVAENSPTGAPVGTVIATETDGGQQLTYSITDGNDGHVFAINAATGEITVDNAAVLDFEVQSAYVLTVQVTDDGAPQLSVQTSVVVLLDDVNDAPVLDDDGMMSLVPINQADTNNKGTLVSELLASTGADRVDDQDLLARDGIAVVGADTTNGSWQYSTDGGQTWWQLGAVTDASARLLSADARIRFVPAAGYNGTVVFAITFRAWDLTTGTNGGLADTTANGGTTAFSIATEVASLRVRSAIEQVGILSGEVNKLLTEGNLSSSAASTLQSKLSQARKHLERGNLTPADNQLNLFISDVTDLVATGQLAPEYGDDLIAKARAVLVSMYG